MKSKEIKYIKSDIIEGVILSDIKEGIMKIKGILILILSLISVFIITSCDSLNIPGAFEPSVRTLGATIPVFQSR